MASPIPPTSEEGRKDPHAARRPRAAWLLRWAAAVVLGSAVGIGLGLASRSKATQVSGTVTFAGREVEKGFITFFPADHNGNTKGAKIIGGQYTLTDLPRGKKRVLVTALPQAVVVPASRKERQHVELKPPEVPVPSNALGNNEVVEITGSNQTLDIRLEKPR
jgi:hypothetical protein